MPIHRPSYLTLGSLARLKTRGMRASNETDTAHRSVAVLGNDDVELAGSLAFHVVVLVAIEQQDEVTRCRNLEIAG